MSHRRPQHAAGYDPSSSSYSSQQPIGGGYAGGGGGGQPYHYGMEQENDQHVGILGDKLSQLKQISIAIGDELHLQRNLMDEMDKDFDKTGSFLESTMRRLNIMARKQNGRWMWYLILFVLAVFFYIYLFRYRR
ncbi:uncharacterized protein EV422DRAFT_571382 [Fimicolochytrium jonesii]|uniref:uncharacterized protein n=1 Tax=Fimicolochytrium jonesii TaxID=1396493 RepID=UPI0022FDDB6C|nr:uncharacterized protein EV422DRAFT_571382 [Fimicolochytrium jonesii]KAI8816849.1 hypothetical protein EV422DRAFT_571382 [Fimicolochytrium jonesii]